MSLLFRDELRINLSPEAVSAVYETKGLLSSVKQNKSIACPQSTLDDVPWVRALESLDTLISQLKVKKKTRATIVLSNHFVRYTLVPWNSQIATNEEIAGVVKHRFVQTYGVEARHWLLKVSNEGFGKVRIASAIDQPLFDGLQQIMREKEIQLVSLQPNWMSTFNQWCKSIKTESFWFSVVEKGLVSLMYVEKSNFKSFSSSKFDQDWIPNLQNLLQREHILFSDDSKKAPLFIFAPGYSRNVTIPDWQINFLNDSSKVPANNFILSLARKR